jgi:hypothetical protein
MTGIYHKIPGVAFASPEWLPTERFNIVSCTAHQPSKLSLLTGFVAATVDGHFFDPGTVTYAPRECLTEPLIRAVHYRKDAAKYHEGAARVSKCSRQRGVSWKIMRQLSK